MLHFDSRASSGTRKRILVFAPSRAVREPTAFVAYREGGLKGRLQARLPAPRKAKAEETTVTYGDSNRTES